MNRQTLLRGATWTLWGLLPVCFLAFHYGPGQRYVLEDKAGRMLASAQDQATSAQAAQDDAYARHLELLGIRLQLRDAEQSSAITPQDKARLKEATQREKAAYAKASEEWCALSTKLADVETLLRTRGSESATNVRIAKARAVIRAGLVNTGIAELDDTLDTLEAQAVPNETLLRQAREELATGHYYNARLMRVAGHATEDWKQQTAQSRQQYRFLAETARETQLSDEETAFQQNIERVLNLEQSAPEDLLAKPMPKNAPESRCQSDKECNCKGKGKKKSNNNGQKDSRGAGNFDDMGPGW